jgi:hypothetical protein
MKIRAFVANPRRSKRIASDVDRHAGHAICIVHASAKREIDKHLVCIELV